MAFKTPPNGRWKRWLIGGVVAVVVLGVGGPFVYKQFVESDNPPALALPAPAPASAPAATPGPAPAANLDGSWKVGSGSQAGYRVNQKVAGQTATTVGRTNAVTGSATVSGGQLTAGTVSVNLAKLVTNEAERDEHVREGILETDQYPNAVFTLTKPVQLGTIAPGQVVQVPAVGQLTIHGATKPATFNLAVRQSGETLSVQGSTSIAFADYGVEPPATIPPTSQIEFLLQFNRS
ncbi:MAG TPA: YceI family protein [Pseudonocardia sp.]|jgi:polyisoprenoid-binding protein YceI|nr:YceI family protein [Pseudonocardia sp.]